VIGRRQARAGGKIVHKPTKATFSFDTGHTTVLPNLTDPDLEKKLGILLGHRRKMLRAIAELNADALADTVPSTHPDSRRECQRIAARTGGHFALGRLQIHSKGRAGRIG
jgi:SAM domain (Sterile alpha motif)